MTPHEVTDVLALLAATFPSLRVTPETLAAWSLALDDADAADVRASALRFIRGRVPDRNHAFAPSVAEVLVVVETLRSERAADARGARLALEADTRRTDAVEAEEAHATMARTGYRDWLAYLADKRAGKLADPADAPHRAWDALRNRVVDTRRRPASGDGQAA